MTKKKKENTASQKKTDNDKRGINSKTQNDFSYYCNITLLKNASLSGSRSNYNFILLKIYTER